MFFYGLYSGLWVLYYGVSACRDRPRKGVVFLFLTRGSTFFRYDVVGDRCSLLWALYVFLYLSNNVLSYYYGVLLRVFSVLGASACSCRVVGCNDIGLFLLN